MANLFVRGILLNGSHQGMCEAGLPPDFAQSLLVAAHRFQAVVGSPPELVLFKSLYWDLRKVFEKGETVEPLVAARRDWQSWMQHELGFVCPYTAEVTRALFDIRAAFPGAVVGLRTDPGWNTAENRFKARACPPVLAADAQRARVGAMSADCTSARPCFSDAEFPALAHALPCPLSPSVSPQSKPEYVLSTGTNLMQAVRGVANTFKVRRFWCWPWVGP